MIHLKNIAVGNPKIREQYEFVKQHRVILLFSEDGKDWYNEQKKFSPDTLKLAYDKKGIIRCISTDVSGINPVGLSVVEVENTTANRRADIYGDWVYQNGEVVQRIPSKEEQQKLAEDKKRQLMAEATAAIDPLQDAVDFGEATEAEKSLLLEWRKYRILLMRVDPSLAPDIEWPVPPVAGR